ncbi:hypothetical protein [Dactylococcopsis salina]|nr:hypothetical protein [Dactylococcopsis salina]
MRSTSTYYNLYYDDFINAIVCLQERTFFGKLISSRLMDNVTIKLLIPI